MSSNWYYEGNNLIKKIYSVEAKSIPISYKWYVQLKDGLILDIFSNLLEELESKFNEEEIEKIKEAKENIRILKSRKLSLLDSINQL